MSSTTSLPFCGGELGSFDPFDANTLENTNASFYDVNYARCNINVTAPSSGCTSPKWPDQSPFFHHQNIANVAAQNGWYGEVAFLKWFNNAGTLVAQITGQYNHTTTSVPYTFYTLQGTAPGTMTQVGQITVPLALQTLDVKLVGGASGQAQMYLAGTIRINVSNLNHSAWAGVGQVQLGGSFQLSGNLCHSEIICDSVAHIGDRLFTINLNANSATNTGWTGTVGNINEVILSDNAFISAVNPNLTSTFLQTGLSLSGFNIVGVAVGARTLVGSSGPQNLDLCLRTHSTNYFSGQVAGLANGYQACCFTWVTNPNTGLTWTIADANVAEGGIRSDT